jgi:hypothetical protein
MSEKTVKTQGGKIYYIRGPSFDKYYVSKPGWAGRNGVGSARSLDDALALVKADAGEGIRSID